MPGPWIGSRRIAFIPAIVNNSQFTPPPANWVDQIRQRIYYDPDPISGLDCSLRGYIYTISYGKALLVADIFNPVIVPFGGCGAMQDAAIQATPATSAYEYACVVFTGGTHPCTGWAFWGNPPFPFAPAPSGPILLRNWYYLSMAAPLGVWAMETLHVTTGVGDLYNTTPHPGGFDEMACNCGTHPSVYTKLRMGWLDPAWVLTPTGPAKTTYTLHAVAALQPPPPTRVVAIRIPSQLSQRYFLVEARLRLDQFEKATVGFSNGIPSEGIVVYEVDENAWPLQLRTAKALTPGQRYTNVAEHLEIEAGPLVPEGTTVSVQVGEHPECGALRTQLENATTAIRALEKQIQAAPPRAKGTFLESLRREQAKLKTAQQRSSSLGCMRI